MPLFFENTAIYQRKLARRCIYERKNSLLNVLVAAAIA